MSLVSSLKSGLGSIAKDVAPKYYWTRRINQYKQHFNEVEMKLLPFLCKKDKTSIDIGAAGGVFVANMLDLSRNVIAFEPIPKDAAMLSTMIRSTNSNAIVECVALSNERGEATLRMIVNDLGRSTIEESNALHDETGSQQIGIKVPIRTLDEFKYENVGFVKIDVEGHEWSVLNGAMDTIKRNLPTFLIEIEDRHKENAVHEVPAFMTRVGYACFFVLDGKLKPISEFNKSLHQDSRNIGTYIDGYVRKGIYINNFIFIPHAEVSAFLSQAELMFHK